MTFDQVVVAASPKAGSGGGRSALDDFQACLGAHGVVCRTVSTLDELDESLLPFGDNPAKCLVVAAGGDGTLNLLASRVPAGFPLLPYPLGTENLVARHYGLFPQGKRLSPEQMADAVLHGVNQSIDAGVALFPARGLRPARQRLFLIMASVGFDAEVVRRMHLTRRGHIRRWSYFKPIWQTFRTYRYPLIRVESVGLVENVGAGREAKPLDAEQPLTVAWALVFNLPQYAARLAICPNAKEDDGLLDFCGLIRGTHKQGLRYLLGVLSKQHRKWKDVVQSRASGWRLTSQKRLAVQLDGDYVGRLPVELSVAPSRVLLRLPASYGARCDVRDEPPRFQNFRLSN